MEIWLHKIVFMHKIQINFQTSALQCIKQQNHFKFSPSKAFSTNDRLQPESALSPDQKVASIVVKKSFNC